MPVIRYKRHPLAPRGTSWDGPREVAAADVDDLKVMCTWYAEPGENKGDYKLPHHRQSDKYTVWRGVTAAMGALLGARGGMDIPSSDRRGVYNHLARHYGDFNEEAPEFREYSEDELRAMFPEDSFEEPVVGPAAVRAEVQPVPQDIAEVERALRIINAKFARQPLSVEDIYIFPAEMSNQHIDTYGTRMTSQTLQNYADDARAGIPLMNSHRTGGRGLFIARQTELPLGRSYDARLSGKPIDVAYERAISTPRPIIASEAGQRLTVDFYIVRGLKMGEVDAYNAIRGIESGIIIDTSIGFRPGWYRCAICGENYLSRECEHIVLVRYDDALCFAWVEEGRLIEGSLVFSGATPEAMIRKARAFAPQLSKPDVAMLEERYQTRLLDSSYYAVGWSVNRREKRKEVQTMPDIGVVDVGAIVREHGPDILPLLEGKETVEALVNVADSLLQRSSKLEQEAGDLKAKLEEMKPRAERGDCYVQDLVEEAIKSRIRAQGDGFDAERYKARLLVDPDIDFIKGEIESYEGQVGATFQPGRQVEPKVKEPDAQAEARFHRV